MKKAFLSIRELRSVIRRSLLTEAMRSVDELPEWAFVTIRSTYKGIGFEVVFTDSAGKSLYYTPHEYPRGSISALYSDLPCGGAFYVGLSHAESGWGPLLYDIAMEYASLVGGGLSPDRISVSEKARSVWNYYMSNRKNIKMHQLDDEYNSLTPDDGDNCTQVSSKAQTRAMPRGMERWEFSPLSKRYTKSPTTIKKLIEMKKLITDSVSINV